MKVFGNPMSTCTRKVLMTLAEKQAKYDFVTIDFTTGAHKSPEHMARQPFGQVPALEDGDFRMFESRAICRYLDETLPGHPLTPKDPKGRALMEQWISVEMENFTPHAMGIIREHMFAPMRGQQPDLAKVEAARAKLDVCVNVLDKHLAKGPHMLGDAFTIADISYMPYIEYLMQTPSKDAIANKANVAAWWKRISERPSWQKAIGKS